MPEPRPIDLTAALLLSAAVLALSVAAGAALLLVAIAAGYDAVSLDAAWTGAGAAFATVALLVALTGGAIHPAALAVAAVLSAAWPLCGAPLAGAVVATAAIALVVRWGGRATPLPYPTPLAALCAALALAGLAVAVTPAGEAAPAAVAAAGAAGAGSATQDGAATHLGGAAREAGSVRSGDATRAGRPARGDSAVRAVIAGYYRALDRRAFGEAWRSLSPTVRATFGGYATWRAGFAQTVSSTPRDLDVTVTGATATATHRLVARDRAACGVATQEFVVRWELRRTGANWRAVSLRGAAGGARVAPLC